MLNEFSQRLTPENRALFLDMTTPVKIQAYLDSIPYVGEELDRSPLRLMQDRQGHCLDGGVFAALALSNLGHPPLLLDMLPEPGADDDHILALFRAHGLYGAVAKSNFAGLRYREPVYRSLRELVMSYFDDFFNSAGRRTMRAYCRPLHLSRFDRYGWMWSEAGMNRISRQLYRLKPIPVLPPQSIPALTPVDERSYQAGMLGVNVEGLYPLGE
ncbi:MAG: hypothetical protein L0Z70_00145 [Chloroflexi bacterium]|nr:hypothetical protein [Chloroflexota bacterium]